MEDLILRTWEGLGGRIDGPFSLRLILQPLVASVLAIRAGIADARVGRRPYAWAFLTRPEYRGKLLKEAWNSIGKVFVIAIVIDTIYQFMTFGSLRPVELLLVGFLLACVPYFLVRGPANRIYRSLLK